MPDAIPTNVTAERFDRYAARGLADEAPDRKEDLRLAAQHLIWALGHLRDAGAKAVDMAELARVGHDRDLDAAGCWFDPVDLTELDALT
jgi:hypothetical protein